MRAYCAPPGRRRCPSVGHLHQRSWPSFRDAPCAFVCEDLWVCLRPSVSVGRYCRPALNRIAVLLTQRLLVELTNARFSEGFDEDDLLRHAKFRDGPLVAVGHYLGLERLFGHRRFHLRIAYDQRKRTFSPACILDADHRALLYPDRMRDDILKLKRGDPFATGFNDVLDAVGDL